MRPLLLRIICAPALPPWGPALASLTLAAGPSPRSLAISKSRRETYSWGWGDFGRLGHGDCRDMFVPTPIPTLSGIPVVAAACGDTHTLVLTEAGEVYSFGRNQNGQLGTGTLTDALVPQLITALQVRCCVGV